MLVIFRYDHLDKMTAVSLANMSYSQNHVSVPVAPRGGAGVISATNASPTPSDAGKPELQANQDPAVEGKVPVSASSKAELASQVRDLQFKMDKLNPALAFVVDQSSGRALIQLTDRDTKEIIQQFPTAAAIQISKALDRFEKGRLINKTV